MNLLQTMQEECPSEMKPDMTETNISIRSLQNTIDKYKKLAQEQAQVIVQKEMLVKSLRSEVTKLKQLLEEKTQEVDWQKERESRLESDLTDTKKRLKAEEQSSRRWYLKYREKEEELAKERAKTAWKKFREKHRIFRRKHKIPNYSRRSLWERIGGKLVFAGYCIIWVIIGVALFRWLMGI